MKKATYSCSISDEVKRLSEIARDSTQIDSGLYAKYEVKRGLRDVSGKGVLAGLTEIAEIIAYIICEGDLVPCEGKLFYRGIDIEKIVGGFIAENRFGFEETCYLLLFGKMPSKEELSSFGKLLTDYRVLPANFFRDVIMEAPSKDMMNTLARSVLTLYAYDDYADDISVENILRQSLQLIAVFPMLSVYGYQAFIHYHSEQSLVMHAPDSNLSTAENILHMLRKDSKYSALEAQILDIALVLHAEHGGGNNSTFTNHVVTSSGTDTYSAVAAALGSLKGPRHGGANIKVIRMFEDMKKSVKNWDDDEEISAYLIKLLNKEAFDKAGLIYGMGHAVYTLSDPRALIFKQYVEKLAQEKHLDSEYRLYLKVEQLAPKIIEQERNILSNVSANIDFYSGFVYSMLDLPPELYTPIFAIARIAGWSAHRIEEIVNSGKIIRPAYKSVAKQTEYVPIEER
jgi:citrate synthase